MVEQIRRFEKYCNILVYKTILAFMTNKSSEKTAVKTVDLENVFQIMEVPADGNCFFHSVIAALSNANRLPSVFVDLPTQKRVHSFRLFLCRAMRDLFFSKFLDAPYEDFFRDNITCSKYITEADALFKPLRRQFLKNEDERCHLDAELSNGAFGFLSSKVIEERPLAKAIMDNYFIVEEFPTIAQRHREKLEELEGRPKTLLSSDTETSARLLADASAESLLLYIYRHAKDGVHIDMLVFAPLIADLFNVTIQYCFIESGTFCMAENCIKPSGESKATITLVSYIPVFPHYNYLLQRKTKAKRPRILELKDKTELEMLRKKDYSYPVPTKLTPQYQHDYELQGTIRSTIIPFLNPNENNTVHRLDGTDYDCPTALLLTGKDLSLPIRSQRHFMAGNLVCLGLCGITQKLYYGLRTQNLDCNVRESSLFVCKRLGDTRRYQPRTTGVLFSLDPSYHDHVKEFWQFQMTLYGMWEKPQGEQDKKRAKTHKEKLDFLDTRNYNDRILSQKPHGDLTSCIFYAPGRSDIPDLLILEVTLSGAAVKKIPEFAMDEDEKLFVLDEKTLQETKSPQEVQTSEALNVDADLLMDESAIAQ